MKPSPQKRPWIRTRAEKSRFSPHAAISFRSARTVLLLCFCLIFARASTATTFKLVHTWKAPHGVSSVAFAPDGKRVFYGSLDGSLNVWNLRQNIHRRLWKSRSASEVTPMTLSRSGRYLAFGVGDNVAVWNVARHRLQWLHNQTQADHIIGLSFSPDEELLASRHNISHGEGGTYGWGAWSTVAGRHLQNHELGQLDSIDNIVFARDNRTLLIYNEAGFFRIKTRRSGGPKLLSLHAFLSGAAVAKSRVGKLTLRGKTGASGEEALFIVSLLQSHQTFLGDTWVGDYMSPTFSRDRRLIALGNDSWIEPIDSHQISVWNMAIPRNKQKPIRLLPGMRLAQFSPVDNLLITGSADSGLYYPQAGRIIRLWSYSG